MYKNIVRLLNNNIPNIDIVFIMKMKIPSEISKNLILLSKKIFFCIFQSLNKIIIKLQNDLIILRSTKSLIKNLISIYLKGFPPLNLRLMYVNVLFGNIPNLHH